MSGKKLNIFIVIIIAFIVIFMGVKIEYDRELLESSRAQAQEQPIGGGTGNTNTDY